MTDQQPDSLLRRLEARDATLWPQGNVSKDRLGWLDVPKALYREAKELRSWAESIDQSEIVLLGMGGSSLGPLVLGTFAADFGVGSGRRLHVCDTTEPGTVGSMPYEDAFILVSSKSGTTLEPNVLFSHAKTVMGDPKRYAFITDPGTPLQSAAEQFGANRVFANQPDIGGRYSVLSYFGLVPAALLGYDIEELCDAALSADRTHAAELGIEMALAARAGKDKATIVVDERRRAFGWWVEQLIAESTGKSGTGIVPVPTSDHEDGDDRFVIDVAINGAADLGAAFYRFEYATALAGHILGIDPFSEPNVAESKANTNRVLSELPLPNVEEVDVAEVGERLRAVLHIGDYVSIQAYLPFGIDASLEAFRRAVRDAHDGLAVTAGYGPRFLHSTGQLHKGGPPSLVALQVVARSPRPLLSIPGENYDFATLIDAQAIGDYQSLVSHERRVLRVRADDLAEISL